MSPSPSPLPSLGPLPIYFIHVENMQREHLLFYFPIFSYLLTINTHTHTHTRRERERMFVITFFYQSMILFCCTFILLHIGSWYTFGFLRMSSWRGENEKNKRYAVERTLVPEPGWSSASHETLWRAAGSRPSQRLWYDCAGVGLGIGMYSNLPSLRNYSFKMFIYLVLEIELCAMNILHTCSTTTSWAPKIFLKGTL